MHDMLVLGASAALVAAMLCDLAFRLIPDVLPLALAALGIGSHLLDGHLAASLGCGAAVFVPLRSAGCRGWMGGGDVKLLAATAILLPPVRVPGFIAAVALAGGVLALLYCARDGWLAPRRPRPAGRAACACAPHRASSAGASAVAFSLPYATAIAAGALL